MNMGEILNGFVTDLQAFWVIVAACCAVLAIFSVLYNRWMDDLGDKKRGYTALLVSIGNIITLIVVAAISYKAALIVFAAFAVSGAAMIAGDIKRESARREAEQEQHAATRKPRRKALPYAAAGLVDEATMLLSDAKREIKRALDNKSDPAQLGKAGINLAEAIAKLAEARKIEGE